MNELKGGGKSVGDFRFVYLFVYSFVFHVYWASDRRQSALESGTQ